MNFVRSSHVSPRHLSRSLLAVIGALLLTPQGAFAAIINVTTIVDESNVANAQCSLREAIESADSDSAIGGCTAGLGIDTIEIPEGVYQLTTGEELSSFDSVNFQGAGRDLTIVEQIPGSDKRILSLDGTGVVHISGMTFQHGNIPIVGSIYIEKAEMTVNISDTAVLSNTALGNGAGIFSSGPITLTNSVMRGNHSGDTGGALFGNASTVTLINTVISHNEAEEAGGGIAGQVGLVMRNSQIVDNQAGRGGGVYYNRNSLIEESLIARNVATDTFGGGIVNLNGVMVIRNSTVQENSAAEGAGGIGNAGINFAPFVTTSMHIEGTDILSNSARSGGGIGNVAPLFISDTLIAGNSATELGGGIGNDSFIYSGTVGFAISGTLSLHNVNILNNQAGRGGGIATGGVLTITESLIQDNRATLRGGGVTIGNGNTVIVESSVRENEAPTGAGVFVTFESQYGNNASKAILNATEIADNLGHGLAVAGGAVELTDVVLARQDEANCLLSGGSVTSKGNNRSSDSSCAAVLTGPGDDNGTGEGQEELRLPSLMVAE